MYTFKDIEFACNANKKSAIIDFNQEYSLAIDLYDKMQFLIYRYQSRFLLGIGDNKHSDVILSTLIKSMYNLSSVIDLTINGHIGAARIVIRNIFEFLVLGKYILIREDKIVNNRWDKIEYVSIGQAVFNETVYPKDKDKEAFKKLWVDLSLYTHATRVSGQITYEYDYIKKEIKLNFNYILLLLVMLYNYMNAFLATPYFKRYIKSLAEAQPDDKNLNKAVLYQEYLNKTIKRVKAGFNDEGKKIINYYAAKWRFSPPKNLKQKEERFTNQQTKKDYLEKNKLFLKNKEDLINYLDDFIKLYNESKEEPYRAVLLKYLKKTKKMIQGYRIKTIQDNYRIYHYVVDITSDSIKLILCSTNKLSFEKEGEDCYKEEVELLNIKSEFLSVDEYATLYNVSIPTVKRWISKIKIHKAKVIGDKWYIPELQPKPEPGFYMVEYNWIDLPEYIKSKYPFLNNLSDLTIYKISSKNIYGTTSFNADGEIIELNEEARIALEKDLLKYAENVNETRALYVPC